MARIAVAGLSVALWLCTGCFVFDEIDQGRKILDKHAGHTRPGAPAQEEAPAPEPAPEQGPSLFARAQAFLAEHWQREAPEGGGDTSIVSCELEDGTTFTRESVCLSQGGRVL